MFRTAEDWAPKEIDEYPLKTALGRITNVSGAAATV